MAHTERTRGPLRTALIILGVGAVLIVLIEVGFRMTSSQVVKEFNESLVENSNTEEQLLQVLGLVDGQVKENLNVPGEFRNEVLDLEEFSEVRSQPEAGLVGFWAEGELASVHEKIERALLDKNWAETPSSNPNLVSYLRGEGTYRWVYLSYSPLGSGVSVVLHYR